MKWGSLVAAPEGCRMLLPINDEKRGELRWEELEVIGFAIDADGTVMPVTLMTVTKAGQDPHTHHPYALRIGEGRVFADGSEYDTVEEWLATQR